jgi:hypothetical protein
MGLTKDDDILHELLSSDCYNDKGTEHGLSDKYLDELPRQNGIPPVRPPRQ